MSRIQSGLRKRPVKTIWIIGLSFVVGGSLFLLAVPMMAPCWHMMHGDYISYDEWTIRVPDHFFANVDGVMWRLNPGSPLFKAAYGHISFFRHSKAVDLDRDYTLFESAVVAEGMKSGLQVKSHLTINIDGHEGRCLQMSNSKGTDRTIVRCLIAGDDLLAFYEGYPQYVPRFYSMVEGMHKKPH